MGTRDLSNKTDLKDNAYQMTSQENMWQLPIINKLNHLSIARRQTLYQSYKKGRKQKTNQQCYKFQE